jgi:hypothetical protein
MTYRMIVLVGLGLLTAACGQGNIYSVTPQEAYDKLVAAPVTPSGKGPFGMLDVSAHGDGANTVRWTSDFGPPLCEANITPEGAAKSKIMVYCGGGGEGAATGMMQAMHRNAIIEHIDATLSGRAYDPQLALGSTAGSWPDDPRQADGSYGAAVGSALKMQRDTEREIQDMDRQAQLDRDEEAAHRRAQGVNFKPGEPMVDPSSSSSR